jgi:hypothetical protein
MEVLQRGVTVAAFLDKACRYKSPRRVFANDVGLDKGALTAFKTAGFLSDATMPADILCPDCREHTAKISPIADGRFQGVCIKEDGGFFYINPPDIKPLLFDLEALQNAFKLAMDVRETSCPTSDEAVRFIGTLNGVMGVVSIFWMENDTSADQWSRIISAKALGSDARIVVLSCTRREINAPVGREKWMKVMNPADFMSVPKIALKWETERFKERVEDCWGVPAFTPDGRLTYGGETLRKYSTSQPAHHYLKALILGKAQSVDSLATILMTAGIKNIKDPADYFSKLRTRIVDGVGSGKLKQKPELVEKILQTMQMGDGKNGHLMQIPE